ncbi:hypothetical protein D9611_003778 [Ephemerocybe angulata]|uniref:Nephrocystin 3-like N-terminal domain-containing protein n=1 Tax=Ephemerocybe angulata TaxID=980116 RepID=A0A8H5EYN7_9AGAR|nr:hypothetical protein D9611_003778 [Tulosesus angulatus]
MAEAIGVASAVVSLLTLAAQVTKLSYLYVSDYQHASKSQKSYLLEISALSDVLLQVESILDNEDRTFASTFGAQLTTLIDDCRPMLEKLSVELESRAVMEGQAQRFFSDIVWPFKEKEVKQHIETIHRFRSMISNVISLHTHSISIDTQQKINDLRQEQEKRQVVEWLALPDAHNSQVSAMLEEEPCPETMEWFFQTPEYFAWQESPKSLLWCHGKPGVGKSMLSAATIHQLTPRATVLYHICSFSGRSQQSTVTVLKLLIQQVLSKATDSQVSILLKHREKSSASPKAASLLSALLETCPSNDAFLILDALDEFDDRRTLFPILKQLVHGGWRVMVTSRQLPDIEDALRSYPQVEVTATKEDLELYVSRRLEESDFESISNNLSIISSIVDKAGGIFLLARLIMDRLLELTTIKAMRLFLANMPSTVHDGYTSSLERILALPPTRSALALRMIGWIARAERRLRISEALHALAYEADTDDIDEDNIPSSRLVLQACVGLVYLEKETSTLKLIHETAYQFFRDVPQLRNIETDIATTSIGYLSLPTLSSPCTDIATLLQRHASKPFLAYAARFWGIHGRRVEGQILPEIRLFLADPRRISSSFQVLQSGEWRGSELAAAVFQSLPSGQQSLHIAAYWGLDATISALLSAGENPWVQDGDEWTPLHWAVSNGHHTSVNILLKFGVNVDAVDSKGWTPLFWAAFRGHPDIAATLLENGCNHRVRDINGWTSLHWAITRRQVDIIKMLLEHHRQFVNRISFIKIPVKTLTVARAKDIISMRDGHERRRRGATEVPLELAAETEDADIFELLLSDFDQNDSEAELSKLKEETLNKWWPSRGFDPPSANIWRALTKGEYHFGQQHYLDRPPEGGSKWKSSMLHVAIKDNKLHVAEMLLELGADPTLAIGHDRRRTALHVATFRKDTRFVELILKANPETVLLKDKNNRTALMQAVMNGFLPVAIVLLNHGSEVNLQDGGGNTPLILAAGLRSSSESLEFVKELLRRGADPSVQNNKGGMVLHYAPTVVIENLLSAGMPANIADKEGRTPLDFFIANRGVSTDEETEPVHDRVLLSLLQQCDPSPKHSLSALGQRNWNAFRLLLAHGIEPSSDDLRLPGHSFARSAFENEQLDIFRYLVERGAVFEATTTYSSVIHDLFQEQYWPTKELKEVERLEASLEALRTFQPALFSQELMTSVLHRVIKVSESEAHFRLLLKYGASIFAVDTWTASEAYTYKRTGLDAFVHSALNGHWKDLSFLVSLLPSFPPPSDHWILQAALDEDISSDNKIRRLLGAMHRAGEFDRTVMEEMSYGKRKDSTPIQLAARRGDLRGLKVLLDVTGSTDMDAADGWGWTLLHWAVHLGHQAVFDFLIERGADVSARAVKWSTEYPRPSGIGEGVEWGGQPLHLAAMFGQKEMARTLLLWGADANALVEELPSYGQVAFGPSALHIALYTGKFYGGSGTLNKDRLEVARILVEAGASVRGVADHLGLDDIVQFEGYEDLWDSVRVGITPQGRLTEIAAEVESQS